MQLTHNGRNQVGDGRGVDKKGSRLTPFGVAVVQEMNRLGVMVGVAHLSTDGLIHAAEISKTPLVSTHQNLERYTHSRPPVEITEEEAKIIAKTGGIVGIRYHSNTLTPYTKLAEEVEYLCKLIGPEHVGVGWLGHDKANPGPTMSRVTLRGRTRGRDLTIYEHYDNFIRRSARTYGPLDQDGSGRQLSESGAFFRRVKELLLTPVALAPSRLLCLPRAKS
jgi:hypothetical protein